MLTQTMDEGTIAGWRKHEGESVKRGEALLILEADKVTTEVAAPASGILRRVRPGAGETAPVGRVIACTAGPDEPLP